MSTIEKVHNSSIPSLDLQLLRIVQVLNGLGNPGDGVAIPSDHGAKYTLFVTRMVDEGGNLVMSESGHPIPELVLKEV